MNEEDRGAVWDARPAGPLPPLLRWVVRGALGVLVAVGVLTVFVIEDACGSNPKFRLI